MLTVNTRRHYATVTPSQEGEGERPRVPHLTVSEQLQSVVGSAGTPTRIGLDQSSSRPVARMLASPASTVTSHSDPSVPRTSTSQTTKPSS